MESLIMNAQQILTLILPLLAYLLSYGLQQMHWSSTINGAIAGCSILVAAVASALLQGKLTGNFYSDLAYVLAASTALQAEAFAPLSQYLRGNFPIPPADPTPHEPPTQVIPTVPPPGTKGA
jgi:hypothetical protein